MKKSFIIICFMYFCIGTTVKAQIAELTLRRVEFGARFMPTISNFNMSGYAGSTVAGSATFGYGFGGMLAVNLTKHYAIQTEVIYNSLSQKFKDQSAERKIHVNYINIPVLFVLSTSKEKPVHLNFVAGPQMGFSVGSDVTTADGNGTDTAKAVFAARNGDLGFAYGAGLGFALNSLRTYRLDMGFRGVYGFTNVSNTSQAPSGNSRYVVQYAAIRTSSIYIGLTILL